MLNPRVRKISQLDPSTTATPDLAGALLEMSVQLSAGVYGSRKITYEQFVATLPGGVTSPNHTRGLLKAFRYATRAEVAANGNFGESLEDLVYASCCIQTQAKVELYQPADLTKPRIGGQIFVAVFDPSDTPAGYVYVDGSFKDGELVPAKFVPIESQEAKYGYVRRDTNPASIDDWHLGELSIWTLNGADQFATAKQVGGPFPAFTGVEDAYWKPAAAPTQPVAAKYYDALGDQLDGAPTNRLLKAVAAGKADLVNGLVPASQLPSYVDDVLEFAQLSAFPATGESGKIYVALNTNKQYRYSGSGYALLSDSGLTVDQLASFPATASAANKLAATSDLAYVLVGPNPTRRNVGLGPLDASTTLLASHYYNVFGYGIQNLVMGANAFANTFGSVQNNHVLGSTFEQNIFGSDLSDVRFGNNCRYNVLGSNISIVRAGNGCEANILASGVSTVLLADNVISCRVGPGCQNVSLLAGCQRVELYNCSGPAGSPFTIAAGSKDQVWRNNVLVGTGSGTSYDDTAIKQRLGATTAADPAAPLSAVKNVLSQTLTLADAQAMVAAGSLLPGRTYIVDFGPDANDKSQIVYASALQANLFNRYVTVITGGTVISQAVANFKNGALAPVASGGSSATLVTGIYPAENGGPQTITNGLLPGLDQATKIVSIGIRGVDATGDPELTLLPSTAYSFDVTAHTITLPASAGIAQGNVLEIAWLTPGGLAAPAPVAVVAVDYTTELFYTAATTLTADAAYKSHVFSGNAPFALTLPAASTCTGKLLAVRVRSTAQAVFMVAAQGSDTVNNEAGFAIWTQESLTLLSTGTGWTKVSSRLRGMSADIALEVGASVTIGPDQYQYQYRLPLTRELTPPTPGMHVAGTGIVKIQRSARYLVAVRGRADFASGGNNRIEPIIFRNQAGSQDFLCPPGGTDGGAVAILAGSMTMQLNAGDELAFTIYSGAAGATIWTNAGAVPQQVAALLVTEIL